MTDKERLIEIFTRANLHNEVLDDYTIMAENGFAYVEFEFDENGNLIDIGTY